MSTSTSQFAYNVINMKHVYESWNYEGHTSYTTFQVFSEDCRYLFHRFNGNAEITNVLAALGTVYDSAYNFHRIPNFEMDAGAQRSTTIDRIEHLNMQRWITGQIESILRNDEIAEEVVKQSKNHRIPIFHGHAPQVEPVAKQWEAISRLTKIMESRLS